MSGEPRTLTHSVDIDLVGVAKLKSVSPEPSDQGVINGETTILRFRVQDGERITLDMGRRQVEVVVNPRAGGGYPVAARDEAAELRAENERLRADLFEYVLDGFVQGAHRQEDGGYHTGGVSTYRDLGNWLVEHAHWTRRPGGRGRNQVYDPPKADAASEGQS